MPRRALVWMAVAAISLVTMYRTVAWVSTRIRTLSFPTTSIESKNLTVDATTTTAAEASNQSSIAVSKTTAAADSNRRTLVLHIGPHKTATSTIQCELTYLRFLLHQKANFTYLGRQYGECVNSDDKSGIKGKLDGIDTRSLVSCLDRHSTSDHCQKRKEWKRLEKVLANAAAQNTNLILSDEAFARMKINDDNLGLLFQTIHQSGYQLKLVLVYRHYFSWFPSVYNEAYKPLDRRQHYQKWPSQGGERIEPFVKYFRKHFLARSSFHGTTNSTVTSSSAGHYKSAAHSLDLHPVAYLRERWANQQIEYAPGDDDVIVIDMHDNSNNDMTVKFVRQALSKEAAEAVVQFKAKRDKNTIPSRENPSLKLNLDFDMMTVQAQEMGLLIAPNNNNNNSKLKRRPVARYVEAKFRKDISYYYTAGHGTTSGDQNVTRTTIPRLCLNSTELELFQARSVLLEGTVVGGLSHDDKHQRRQKHQELFNRAVLAQKFCNLDTQALLQEERVQRIFRSLGKEKV